MMNPFNWHKIPRGWIRETRTSAMAHAVLLYALLSSAALAYSEPVDDRYLSLQTNMPYEELSVVLQEAALRQGWTIKFIQPVDTGFRNRGLDVGVMRILMLEPGDAMNLVALGGTALASLLPLRIMVFQESPSVLGVSALRPSRLTDSSVSSSVEEQLRRWDTALEAMLQHVNDFDMY